jgi:D-alanyl-D-alanine carboxypeptidase
MRRHALALAAALALGLPLTGSCAGRTEMPHPGFSLSLRDLGGIVAGLPETPRTEIASRPGDFLELMRGVLEGPQDLLAVVDKIRGLSPEFTPADLVALSRFPLRTSKPDMKLRAILIPDLSAMSEAARAAGSPLVISSAWRSYQYQERLYASALARQPREEVEKTLAPPGHSQHQLGTAIDFGSIDVSFAETAAGQWLFANAGSFGFSLSFPRGEESLTGYSWEPWHYRYVGRSAAQLIDGFFAGRQQDFLEFYEQKKAVFSQKLRR